MAKSTSITKDNVSKVFKRLSDMMEQKVLVGVPAAKATRPGDDMNNAAIAYVMEFGSPKRNIPARPFLIPGVQAAEKPAIYQLRKAAKSMLNGDPAASAKSLNAAGVIASNSVRDAIVNGNFVPLSPVTIMERRHARDGNFRKSELMYLALYSSGMSAADAQSAAGIKPLINTGALLASITYVIRKN